MLVRVLTLEGSFTGISTLLEIDVSITAYTKLELLRYCN